MNLDYQQRKALRRLGRGQSLRGRMLDDPIISRCYSWPEFARPTKPMNEMNVVEWGDWAALMCSVKPLINDYGVELLRALDGER